MHVTKPLVSRIDGFNQEQKLTEALDEGGKLRIGVT